MLQSIAVAPFSDPIQILCLIFGVFIVILEKWYCQQRSKTMAGNGKIFMEKNGFKAVDGEADYERNESAYEIELCHLPKKNFFDRHVLILRLKFEKEYENPPKKLEFMWAQGDKFPKYNWDGNSVYQDLRFYRLTNRVIKKINWYEQDIFKILEDENLVDGKG